MHRLASLRERLDNSGKHILMNIRLKILVFFMLFSVQFSYIFAFQPPGGASPYGGRSSPDSNYTIEIPGKIRVVDRDCFVASLLAMTYTSIACHCEERSGPERSRRKQSQSLNSFPKFIARDKQNMLIACSI
jgi:hypothetical protein